MPSVYQSVRANLIEQKLPRQHGLWMALTFLATGTCMSTRLSLRVGRREGSVKNLFTVSRTSGRV
jgi:hypothetical protein